VCPAWRLAVVPKGASILIIQEPWVSLILNGHKTFEIRGRNCKKSPGKRIYIALSGQRRRQELGAAVGGHRNDRGLVVSAAANPSPAITA
jgi:hypothetical protein